MRWNFKPKGPKGKRRCFCTGEGPGMDRRQCHLCKDKDFVGKEFKEVGGHVYCPSCLNSSKN